MASFRSEFVQLRHSDVRIHASLSEPATTSAEKTRPTIVFLHYWGGSTRTWEQVASRVAAAAATYRTVSIDFRGWGLSTGPDDASSYSIEALADDTEEVLDRLQENDKTSIGNRIVLVGLSMGAKVAQFVAARLLKKEQGHSAITVLGVVLASPAPATALQLPPDMREQQLHAYDNAESASFVARNVLTTTFRGGGDGSDNGPPLPGFLVDDMLRGNQWARAAWPAYAMAEDVTATSLHSLGDSTLPPLSPPPVLVLAAANDIVEPLERVKSGVQGCIAGSELEVITKSGHLSPIDAPVAVADAILRFVNKL